MPKTLKSKICSHAGGTARESSRRHPSFLRRNIFIYAFLGHSKQCRELLARCATEQVIGITTFDVINEVTHRMMLAEALANGVINRNSVRDLRGKWREIAKLTEYWTQTAAIFGLNILILATNETRLDRGQTVRNRYGLLTNDSLIVAAMDEFGIASLATRDNDFDHIAELTVYKPTDI